MRKLIAFITLLAIASMVSSQTSICPSGGWKWFVYVNSVWTPNVALDSWCAIQCSQVNIPFHVTCNAASAPTETVPPFIHQTCFCAGNSEDGGIVQSGQGNCETGFTDVEGACVEDCLVDPAQHCATCTADHELCATCQPGFFLKDGACVDDCGAGFYGSKLDWTCYACGYHWVGRQAVQDKWCDHNCFVPPFTAVSFGMNPACLAGGITQTCKCLCPPDNSPNFVVGGGASFNVDNQCQHNTYAQTIANPTAYLSLPNTISRWWVPFVLKAGTPVSVTQKFCEDYCPSDYCLYYCQPI